MLLSGPVWNRSGMVVEVIEVITMRPMMLFALTLLAIASVVDARSAGWK